MQSSWESGMLVSQVAVSLGHSARPSWRGELHFISVPRFLAFHWPLGSRCPEPFAVALVMVSPATPSPAISRPSLLAFKATSFQAGVSHGPSPARAPWLCPEKAPEGAVFLLLQQEAGSTLALRLAVPGGVHLICDLDALQHLCVRIRRAGNGAGAVPQALFVGRHQDGPEP